MKSFLTIIVGLTMLAGQSFSQPIYTTDSSLVSFFSATPIENIEAFNSASTSLLNVTKREITFRIPIAGFQFEKTLMQEHFNESYMESEKFPYATFNGKLSDTLEITKDTIYNVTATGMMNIHGHDRAESLSGLMVCHKGRATLICDFAVALRDYQIKVPKVVFANIAEVIEVKTYFEFKPYEKE
ncbi:MAG: YceI family protein [Flavobacteriales bacterium]|nr:YceI family protein [Flavobacteriales bacterium]